MDSDSVFWIVVGVVVVMFAGDPDISDALITHLMK